MYFEYGEKEIPTERRFQWIKQNYLRICRYELR